MSSLFIVISIYFLNIICFTIFPVAHFTYFEYFPMLIKVFYCISIFIILFSNLLSIIFTAFNISSINIYTFLGSMLFSF